MKHENRSLELAIAVILIVVAFAALPAMAGVHMLIGLGEAAITAMVVAAVARARPELLAESDGPPARTGPAGSSSRAPGRLGPRGGEVSNAAGIHPGMTAGEMR